MLFRWPRLAGPNVPLAAVTNVTPSTDVSSRKSPVAALPPSPQFAVGSTAISLTLTATGSFTTTNFGVATPPTKPDVLFHPTPSDWSMTWFGPQPNEEKSGPLKATTSPPPLSPAQSRRIWKFAVVTPLDVTDTVRADTS